MTTEVYLNHKFIGDVEEPEKFVDDILEKRRKNDLSRELNVFYDRKSNIVHLFSTRGRARRPLIIVKDMQHSQGEDRFYALAKTDQGRRLFIAFTIRKKLIRVVSSRDMNKKERKIYEKG